MELTLVEVGIAGGPFLIGVGAVLVFTSWCIKAMPEPETVRCEEGCRLPIIVNTYMTGTDYWCGGCGSRWEIALDLTKSRLDYLYWKRTSKRFAFPATWPAIPSRPTHAAQPALESVPRGLRPMAMMEP